MYYIHHHQIPKATKLFFIGEWINKLLYLFNRTLFMDNKKLAIKLPKDTDESQINTDKWMKAIWKSYILYDSNNIRV